MSQNHEIKQILGHFYDGTATPEEIREANDFFRSESCVDPDLAADKALFMALDSANESQQLLTPPELTRKASSIVRPAASTRSQLRFLYLAVSAVAAAVLAFVVIPSRTPTAPQVPLMPLADVVAQPKAHAESPRSVQVHEAMAVQPDTVQKPLRRNRKSRNHPPKRNNVTPQERGAQITVDLLNRSLLKVDIACNNVDNTIQHIENSLNRLNNEN